MIRKLKHDDVFELRTWHKDRELAARLSFPDENWFSYVTMQKNVEAYVLMHKDDKVVGYLQVDCAGTGEGCIAFAIKPGQRRKGFGKNLLREFEQIIATKLSLLSAFVEPDNTASTSLLKKSGFTTDNSIDEDGMLRFERAIG